MFDEARRYQSSDRKPRYQKTEFDTPFLSETPFRLIPGIVHPLGQAGAEKIGNALKWQNQHLDTFSYQPEIDVVLTFSEKAACLKQLESLACQSYQLFNVSIVHLAKDKNTIDEIVKSSTLIITPIEVPCFNDSLNLFRAVLPELHGEYVLYLGSSNILHPFALFIFAREAQLNSSSALYSNVVQYQSDWKTAKAYVAKQAPDNYSLLAKNWFGEAFLAAKQILIDIAANSDLQLKTSDGFFWMVAARASVSDRGVKHIPLALICSVPSTHQYDQSKWEHDCRIVLELLAEKKNISLQAVDVNDCGEKYVTPIATGGVGQVQVVIPFYNRADITIKCLESLEKQSIAKELFVTLVDNGSSKSEASQVRDALKDLSLESRVIEVESYFNFAKLNNIGSRETRSPYLLFLNNDVELVSDSSIEELRDWCSLSDVGLVGGSLRYPKGSMQHAGIIFAPVRPANVQLKEQSAELFREVDGVSFAMALCKRDVFEKVGGLDELHCPNGFGDALFCKKLTEIGYRILHTPRADGTHYESLSRGSSIEDVELWDMSQLGLEISDLQHVLVAKRQPMIYPLEGSGGSDYLDKLVGKIKRSPRLLEMSEKLSEKLFYLYSRTKSF